MLFSLVRIAFGAGSFANGSQLQRYGGCCFRFLGALAIAFITCDSASAQLRLGRGIQPGLEGHLIEYQIQQQPLERIQTVESCSVGLGVGCDKTASLLQQIVTDASGKTYQDIVNQAAGGVENYIRFTRYYPENAQISRIPYNSFWLNGGDYVLDNYRYSGIGDLERVYSQDLHQLVSQFGYAPVTDNGSQLSLQQGLIGLKTAYGAALLKEARQIPDIQQRITNSGLSEAETNFHLQQFLSSVSAADNGNTQEFNQALYRLLSNPYVANSAPLNRPALGATATIPTGETLTGDSYVSAVLTGDASQTAIASQGEVFTPSGDNTPLYIFAGVGGLTLLILLLTNLGGSDGGSVTVASNPNPPSEPMPGGDLPDFPDIYRDPVVINDPMNPPDVTVTRIPESTNVLPLIILLCLLLLMTRNRFKHNQ